MDSPNGSAFRLSHTCRPSSPDGAVTLFAPLVPGALESGSGPLSTEVSAATPGRRRDRVVVLDTTRRSIRAPCPTRAGRGAAASTVPRTRYGIVNYGTWSLGPTGNGTQTGRSCVGVTRTPTRTADLLRRIRGPSVCLRRSV